MPKITKAGRVLVPVADQDQAINFQGNQLMIVQARLHPAPQSRAGVAVPRPRGSAGALPGEEAVRACKRQRPLICYTERLPSPATARR